LLHLQYEGRELEVAAAESVLNCLRRHNIPISFGCKQGVCQACMLQAVSGHVSERAQDGLRDTLRHEGYFLACRLYPTGDMTLRLKAPTTHTQATVAAVEPLSEEVVRVLLRCAEPFHYHAGQVVRTPAGDFAIANLPREESLEVHAAAGTWTVGDTFPLEGPIGDSYYVPGDQQDSLLLAGHDTGFAALYGIAREALSAGHKGPIFVHIPSGCYGTERLQELAREYPQFQYLQIDSDLSTAVAKHFPNLTGWRIYLSGTTERSQALRRACFQSGAVMSAIHATLLPLAGLLPKRPDTAAG
jgi:CDP-4-dehydro-6-deoxyglucose reductase, E3